MQRTCVVVIGIVVAVGCGGKKDESARRAAEVACREVLTDPHEEARAWVARPNTMGFEVDKAEMLAIAERFYAAGAPQVEVGYGALDDSDPASPLVGGLLVVTLPASKPARAAVLGVHAEYAARYELDRARDLGQSCLVVGLD